MEKGVLRKGTKTAPIRVKKEKERFVFKVFGRGTGFSHATAKKLTMQTKKYYQQLKSTGMRITRIEAISPIHEIVKGKKTGRWLVASKEQAIERKKDVLETIGSCSKRKARNLYGQMLGQIGLVTSYGSEPNKPVKVLVDSVPKNWVEGKDGKIVFVDFFTPKLLDSKGRLSPFLKQLHTRSRESLQFRYQTKGGIYAVLLTYVAAERPQLRKVFEKATVDFLKKHGETKAADVVMETIANDYGIDFINPKITSKIRGAK